MSSNFNIPGGDLFLVVGPKEARFRINSHFLLRESEWWRQQLLGSESHAADAPLKRGNSSATAYPLKDESPGDFRQLLGVFYNNNYGDYSHIKTEQWIVIQHYANKWGFKEVQALAMRSLDNQQMDTAERIVLYQKAGVPNKFIVPYYMTLVTRPESLGLEECRILGHKNYWFLHHARDGLYAKLLSSSTARDFSDIDKADIANIIKAAYKRTLHTIDPTAGISTGTKNQSEPLTGDAKDEDEGAKSETGSWEDVDGDPGERWEELTIPGSFS